VIIKGHLTGSDTGHPSPDTLLPAGDTHPLEGGFSLRAYETATIWSTSLSDSELEKELVKVQEIISAEEGTFSRSDAWGKRQLAYPIRKQTEGIYVFLIWDGDERVTAGIDKHLRINDTCLRYLTLRRDGSGDIPAPSAPVTDRDRTATSAAAAGEPAPMVEEPEYPPEEEPAEELAVEEEKFTADETVDPPAEELATADETDEGKSPENGGE
jgi:small subunit ribosomal protein S6